MAEFWNQSILPVFRTIRPNDFIDIAIVAFLIYQGIKLVRETRAAQLVKGIAVLLVLYLLSIELQLQTLGFLMRTILQTGIIVIVIVFQPELRRALEQVGRSRISKLGMFSSSDNEQQVKEDWMRFVNALVEEAVSLSRQKIGALLVIERETRLGDIIKTGTTIDSLPSAELIGNIFFPNSPLHDGAMIVREGRLHAAGCFLPLSDNSEISRELGTRHRAALGMSEMSDAIVVVVSEETGLITVCRNGKLERGYTTDRLRVYLESELLTDKSSEPSEKKVSLWKGKKHEES